jgi:hypothetical protein
VDRFNEHALPGHAREEYTASPAPAVNALGIDQQAYIHQAREGLAAVLDRDYPGVGDEGSGPSLAHPRRLPQSNRKMIL